METKTALTILGIGFGLTLTGCGVGYGSEDIFAGGFTIVVSTIALRGIASLVALYKREKAYDEARKQEEIACKEASRANLKLDFDPDPPPDPEPPPESDYNKGSQTRWFHSRTNTHSLPES